MYKIVWVRSRERFKDITCDELVTLGTNPRGAKNQIAWLLRKDITDLRFTPVSLTGEEPKEYIVDYYGRIEACIIRVDESEE